MRDLSDIYEYAHTLEANDCEDLYERQSRSLKARIKDENIFYKKRVKANTKKYSAKKIPGIVILLMAVLLIIGIFALVQLIGGANNDSSAIQSDHYTESIISTEQNISTEPDVSEEADVPITSTTTTTSSSTTPEEAPVTSDASSSESSETIDDTTEETFEEFTVQSYHGYQLGDIVKYNGTVHYSSSYTNELKGACRGGSAMISAINPDGLHPFHLVAIDDTSNVYGWVDEYFISVS